MRILFLGGTRFLGRHAVDVALARGHAVTLFTRGRTANHWGDAVTLLTGDRDPNVAPGLDGLRIGTWDAVIDTSGYVPRVVRASAEMLRGRAAQYLFVSSISVYADGGGAGRDESAPLGKLVDPATEEIAKYYGPLKAACEDEVRAAFGDAAIIVRPGLIVGPHDATDRFGYWVARFRQPALLGGTFNATSPDGLWTWNSLVDALCAGVAVPAPRWIDEALLIEQKAEPWTGLPLWIPSTFADEAGFMEFDCRRATAAGMRIRPLPETIDATAAWLAVRDNDGAWKAVLTAPAEREILASAAARVTSAR
jgi:2'-hydroxyisoflavone reductase